jgi:SAM-dependent methyltransferase
MNLCQNSLETFAKGNIERMLGAWRGAQGFSKLGIEFDYQKLDAITLGVTSGLGHFAGANLLDIGCNSGLHSLVAASVANEVVGCDREELFINRANAAKKALLAANEIKDNVRFVIGDFVDSLDPNINAVLACRILYHIGDDNLEQLMAFTRSNVTRFMIQCRPKRDCLYPPNEIAYTKRFNGLYKVADCTTFLEACGFRSICIWQLRELWSNGESFPVLYASK